MLILCLSWALISSAENASLRRLITPASGSTFSSLIRTVGTGSDIAWFLSSGGCHSGMVIEAESGLSLWSRIPAGLSDDYDWSQAFMWDSRLLFTLVKEPALVAINVRHHYKNDWAWPEQTSWPFSWFYGPRKLHLPKSARLRGPYSVGGSGGLQSDFEGLVLVNSESEGGAGLHVYAVDPSRASSDGANDMALVWELDLRPLVQSAVEASGLLVKVSRAIIVDMKVSDPGVVVSIQFSGSGHGMMVEIWLNGTTRWASDVLAMLPEAAVPSQDIAIALGASSNDELGSHLRESVSTGRELSAIHRGSGAEIWTQSCIDCKVEMVDNKALLIIDRPLKAIESLRMLEISTGKTIWHASPNEYLTPTFCGLPSLTATDIILACECDFKNVSATGRGICAFAFRVANGKGHWALLISDADLKLPRGTVDYGLRPKIFHGNEELAIISLTDKLVAIKTAQGLEAWSFHLPEEQEIVGWDHVEIRSGLLIFRTTASSKSPANTEGCLFAISREGVKVWNQTASLSFPPLAPLPTRTALVPPGILVIDSCYYFDSESSDVQCCIDAHDVLTGERLWTQCMDQSSACHLARQRALLSVCIEWVLILQVVAVIAMLFFVCFRSCLVCLMCCLWWHPIHELVLRSRDGQADEATYHVIPPDDVEGGSGDLEGGSGRSRNWDGVPFLLMRVDHVASPPISSHDLVLAWMENESRIDEEAVTLVERDENLDQLQE